MPATGSAPTLPPDWSQFNSDGITTFTVTNSSITGTPALSGSNDFSVMSGTNGKSGDQSQAWLDETMPADVEVSAAVYVSTLIPAQVIARGSNLDTANSNNGGPSFYAVELSRDDPGPLLSIVKDVNGTETTLASINAPAYLDDTWLVETLDVEGSTVNAQLFDPNTGEYLSSGSGGATWQTNQAWALTVIDNSITGSGFVGLGRPTSSVGTVTFDNFSVQTPSTVQSFDATPVGSLPDNWNWYGTNMSTDVAAVASPSNPTAFSGNNVLAITPANSGDSVRAWLDTSLSANLSVSAYTYLDTLTPAQVFARGSDLDSASPSYYAVEVTRGYMTVSLVKVVSGTSSDLGTSVTSTEYVPTDVWVQETLELDGDNLEAIVYRTDTDQYLDSSGDWVDSWTTAVTATDSSISTGGQAGVGRPVVGQTMYLETDYFDDFTTATGMDTQDFDSTPTSPPSIPTGWSQYISSGNNNFSVVTNPNSSAFLSSSNVLESAGMADTDTSAVWDTNSEDELTNAQVSAAVYVTGLMPTLFLVARGSQLDSSTPSYYGLSFTESGDSGEDLELVRVNDGNTVNLLHYAFPDDSLMELPSADYLGGVWVQETLYVNGDNVQASIYRTDTGQYLNSAGQWQVLPTYAVNLIDPDPLTGAGDAGFVRPSGSKEYAGYIANFAVVPVSVASTPPSVTISAPSGTLSGNVNITATPTEPVSNYSITQLAFYLDDNPNYPLLSYLATSPSSGSQSTWNFDTNSLSNGTHTLLVVATDNEGNIGTATTTITVSNNTTLSLPSSIPAHANSVGITELDYTANDYDAQLLQNDVDVVVVDDNDFSAIHTAYPNDQELLYSNVSNIGLSGGNLYNVNNPNIDLLLNFLNYAEANDVNPEGAFYHVAVATPYSNGSPHSTLPVDEFWGVYDANGNNDTTTAYTGATIPFGNSVNQAVYIGYLEPYWEINFDISAGASGGWSYALEYPTAVDSDNNPTAWGTLTTLSNTTDGFLATGQGQITFNAPSNWVPASIDGSSPMYYVRIVTTTAGTAPVASTIKGDNYTNSPPGSDASGVIPAYDWALDPSGGYLDPQEYAIAAAAGYTAHFGYQSRLFYDGSMRFYTNPGNSTFKAWALTYFPGLVTGTTYATGLFFDNSGANPPDQYIDNIEAYGFNSAEDSGLTAGELVSLVEPTGSYSTDYAALLNEIGQQLADDNPNYWIMANTGFSQQPIGYTQAGQTDADAVISKVQSYYDEFDLAAWSDDTTQFQQLYNQVYYRVNTDNTEYAVMDSTSSSDGSQTAEENGQTQLTTLAAYYLLAPNNAGQGALDFFGGEDPNNTWVYTWGPPAVFNHWSEAASYNVGTPVSPLPSTPKVLVANGEDPENSNYTFNVYERSFTGTNGEPVLVVYKTVSQDGNSEGNIDDPNTATTVDLPGSYYVLQANGTLSSTAVTSISLENGEGAILVDPETDGPEIKGAATVANSGTMNGPASAISANPSSYLSTGSPGALPSESLVAASFERLLSGLVSPNAIGSGLLAEQHDASAELDQFLSLCAVQNLTVADAGSNGPTSNWPNHGVQAPRTASLRPASLWLASLRPSKASNNSSFTASSSPANDAAAGASVDDPVTSSSAS